MNRSTGLSWLALVLALGSSACGQTGAPSTDAGPSVAAVSPGGANAAEVTRFADETPFGPTAIVVRDSTPARLAPGGGAVAATLPAGTDVTKLARHGSDDLVCFDEPKTGRHLMGWIAEAALQDSIPPPLPAPAADDGGSTPPSPPDPPAPHGHHHRPHRPRRQ